jgi:hypothetical protein
MAEQLRFIVDFSLYMKFGTAKLTIDIVLFLYENAQIMLNFRSVT